MGECLLMKREFKIAKIVDEYSIVINGGEAFCVREGDKFEIYDPGVPVKDPDSGMYLGNLEYVKATIVAEKVYPRMTLCKNENSMSAIMKSVASGLVSKPMELNIDAESISGGFDDKIHVGDLVRKISGFGIDEDPENVKVPSSSPED